MNLERLKDADASRKMKRQFGESEQSNKLTYRHTVVNEKEKNIINVHDSRHVMNIQRSKYVIIDNDIEKMKKDYTQILRSQANQKY